MSKSIEQMQRDTSAATTAPVTLLPDPEPRDLFCPIISVDDHVLEPLTLFEDHAAAAHCDALPRVVFDDADIPWWVIDGNRMPIVLANGAAGRPHAEWVAVAPQRIHDFRAGVSDPVARLRDMDLNGVFASLCFPSVVWGFAGTAFLRMVDRDAGLEALRAYNRWMLNEWCAADPERFIPCQLPWLGDPDVAAREIIENAARGFRAVTFSENPTGLGLPDLYSGHWDPFFAACADTGTVVNLHVGSSGAIHSPSPGSPQDVLIALFPVNSLLAVIDWIFARIPLRYPDLRIVLSEGGASWVPMAIERLRRAYRLRDTPDSSWADVDIEPVGLLRNFWFASLEDPAAFRLLDVIGEDRVMVESDYPHADSTWPDTQALIRSETDGLLSLAQIRKVCYENAADLYRHPLPPAELVARSAVGAAA